MSGNHNTNHTSIGYGLYLLVWLGLLALTGVTVAVAGFHFSSLSVVVALLVATLKTTLVMNYFMHLKYEDALFRIMVFICLATFMVFLILTFFDTSFR